MSSFTYTLTYLAIVVNCWGILMADAQSIGDKQFANLRYRHDLSTTLLFAMVPVVNIVLAIFATGFAEHGWRLSRRTK